jgi:hypothetical protein
MEWTIILIVLWSIILWQIAFKKGRKRGEELRDFQQLNEGFRNGRKSIEDEICDMKRLTDEEIVQRIRNFVKNCKD